MSLIRSSLIVVPGAATPANIIPEILWWKLNEGSGTAITADVGPDGTWSTALYWGDGYAGDAGAAWGGGTHEIVSNSAINPGTDKITVTFWLKQPSLATQYIVEFPDAFNTNDATFQITSTSAGKLTAKVLSYVAAASASTVHTTDDSCLTAGQWHFVAVTLDYNHDDDIGRCQIFVDGTEFVDTSPTRNKNPASNGNFGTHAVTIGPIKNAEFDDLRIYSGLLTEEQISAVMANPA